MTDVSTTTDAPHLDDFRAWVRTWLAANMERRDFAEAGTAASESPTAEEQKNSFERSARALNDLYNCSRSGCAWR